MKEKIELEIEGFEQQKLVLVLPTMAKGAAFYVNDQPQPLKRRGLVLNDDHGNPRQFRFANRPLDPMLRLFVDQQEVPLAAPFTWYDYVLIGLPLLLVIFGILGGAIGCLFIFLNGLLLRRFDRSPTAYGAVVSMFILSVLLFFLLSQGLNFLFS